MKIFFNILCLFALLPLYNYGQQPAFPGAQGFGRYTSGGRGGIVYEVTNLSDSGTGSLRYGIESLSGARTIVFRVSGTIELTKTLTIKNGDITIAGQTAPGEGICIKNKPLIIPVAALTATTEIPSYSFVVDADNVIIRYLRFRPGDEIDNAVGAPLGNIKFENDAIWGRNHKNIIIDHCSMSWANDEAASFYDNQDFTMQWCIIGESLYTSYHPKGNHGYGGIWGGWGASFHHNLMADHTSRNPRFCGARYHISTASLELVDFRNNVVFNWAGNSIYGGEGGTHNMINNYFKPGPATLKKGGMQVYRIVNPSVSTDPDVDSLSKWYISGNYMEGYPAITANNNVLGQGFQPQYSDSVTGLWERTDFPFMFASVTNQTAQIAFDSVLNNCGASLFRDTVDKRIIYQVRSGIATTGGAYGLNTGIIDSPSQVGGWPVLISAFAPLDTEHDGMPDDWETANGLDPNNANDRNTIGPNGYTMLEEYLNSLAGEKSNVMIALSVATVGNGSVTPVNEMYEAGTSMTIKAIPDPEWKFFAWSGDTTSTNTMLVLKMNKSMDFTATFTLLPVNMAKIAEDDGIMIRCMPNPVINKALIAINLPYLAHVRAVMFDLSGKTIQTIYNNRCRAGLSEFTVDTSNLISGTYILNFTIDQKIKKELKLIVEHQEH